MIQSIVKVQSTFSLTVKKHIPPLFYNIFGSPIKGCCYLTDLRNDHFLNCRYCKHIHIRLGIQYFSFFGSLLIQTHLMVEFCVHGITLYCCSEPNLFLHLYVCLCVTLSIFVCTVQCTFNRSSVRSVGSAVMSSLLGALLCMYISKVESKSSVDCFVWLICSTR